MKYSCQICGYIYDDSVEKIPFSELPENWKCPMCGAVKSDFIQVPQEKEIVLEDKETAFVNINDNLDKISVGQMAAICSNLSRGCEKQYMPDEAEMFKKLAEYFSNKMQEIKDATVENILARLKNEISEYSTLKQFAENAKDRGAKRVCVWGEKVTRILSSLVDRYIKQGDKLLDNEEIWLCTTCGFVYIGENAPERCPVCKVPSWKFEKIEGRK